MDRFVPDIVQYLLCTCESRLRLPAVCTPEFLPCEGWMDYQDHWHGSVERGPSHPTWLLDRKEFHFSCPPCPRRLMPISICKWKMIHGSDHFLVLCLGAQSRDHPSLLLMTHIASLQLLPRDSERHPKGMVRAYIACSLSVPRSRSQRVDKQT